MYKIYLISNFLQRTYIKKEIIKVQEVSVDGILYLLKYIVHWLH